MKTLTKIGLLMAVLLMFTALPALAEEKAAPTVEEQVAGLTKMCADSAGDRSERQEKESLYDRLGGYDKIHAMVLEVFRLHHKNDQIKHTMEGVDEEAVAKHLTDFISAGTGGTAEYSGRNLHDSHAHLELTDADFLAAGGDIMTAMSNLKYGENEINDFVCILVSMKDQVVFK